MHNLARGRRMRSAIVAMVGACAGIVLAAPALAAGWTPPQPQYQGNGDSSGGDVLSILPPGEHGLYNAAQVVQYEGNGTRPTGADDQLQPYENLFYNASGLTDSELHNYYDDESFGIKSSDITRTETPAATQPVVIYRDQHDVPHVYAQNKNALAFGAGYAAAEDRLFEMDALRHYGAGNLSAFLGPSCADEQMDHDSLLLGGYTTAQKQQQINNLATLYGTQGALLKSMATDYVAGINAYIAAAEANPALLPADYGAVLEPPQPWSVTDVIDIATLVGGIFGKGGGIEVRNAALLQYLQTHFGATSGHNIFSDFKEQQDGNAPTTIPQTFHYGQQGTVDPATTALPDNAAASLSGGPTDTTQDCNLTQPYIPAMQIIASLLETPHSMSNALLVDAAHSADGHPIAVMGPQVGYYTPEILMEEDLHAADFDAEGAAFPGTNFIVELGRGRNFAWSATSAETDNVDQRLELICNPNGGAPAAQGTSYLYNGHCIPMGHHDFQEIAYTKPGGQGAPVVIDHNIYYTVHGVVQGWTTAHGGKPVAVVNQRSTYNHEVDSGIGFLRWCEPSQTYDPSSWMMGASHIQYTFNWFYVDTNTIAYYQSGLLPLRPSNVDPNLPTWGIGTSTATGIKGSEWQGFLGFSGHAHAIGSPTGFMTSWNNRPAPGFSAADDKYSWGPVQRVQTLNQNIEHQLTLHGGKLTRANLVTAMENAAAVDLEARQVLPLLLQYLSSHPTASTGVQAMLNELQQWVNDGGFRRKAHAGDSQYADAAAVAIMDQLFPTLNRALFDSLFGAGGVHQVDSLDAGYTVVPMAFEGTPNGAGLHSGSSYQDGFDGYDWKLLQLLLGHSVATPFSADTTSHVCGSGLAHCSTVILTALQSTYDALKTLIGNSSNVSTWTQDAATHASGQSMPQYDDIQFTAVGIVGQPAIDWQNRPTFQQVVEFPLGGVAGQVPETPALPLLIAVSGGIALVAWPGLRRRRAAGRPRP